MGKIEEVADFCHFNVEESNTLVTIIVLIRIIDSNHRLYES